MGRTFEIRDPESPATSNQTYALYSMCGVDVRKVAMTKGKASDYIDAAKNGKSRHIRVELSQLDGAELKTKDVHRNYRNDPKPRGYKVGNGNGNGNGKSKEVSIMQFLKDNPKVAEALLKEIEAKPEPKPEPVKKAAAPKAKTQKKKSVDKKAEPETNDKPVDIEAALRLMETAIQEATS